MYPPDGTEQSVGRGARLRKHMPSCCAPAGLSMNSLMQQFLLDHLHAKLVCSRPEKSGLMREITSTSTKSERKTEALVRYAEVFMELRDIERNLVQLRGRR